MSKGKFIIVFIISLGLTIASPYYFKSYFEKKPTDLNQTVHFGGPIPFVGQTVVLPDVDKQYPLEVKFQSPIKKKTDFSFVPFIISFIILFALLFSLISIIIRFFKKDIPYKK
ncbi:hypothetical protein [Neobacillus terrae]|uniref:hypothetical protein n=1 Tax=Neobacillus terrae TaxID=3034837 RepID=UPI001407AC8E|nr:hypothetical protein [Neobacillus terrae]NHM29632.1 hypothetical protein [Neobacillus terrae]